MNIRAIMAKATAATEFMYDKTAEIKRYVEYVKPNNADDMRWETVHSDVPCRLSSVKLDNAVQGEANSIQYDTKLFLSSRLIWYLPARRRKFALNTSLTASHSV